MQTSWKPRLAAAAVLALATAGIGLAISPAFGADTTSVESAPLRPSSELPAWRAPGGRFQVSGWAGAGERVQLRAGSLTLATVTAGPLGRFVLRARAPLRAGRHLLELKTPTRRAQLSALRVRPLVLAAGGDVNLGDRIGSAIAARGPHRPWTRVAPLLRAADLALVNLECAVSSRGAPLAGKQYTFRGPPAALAGVARAGVDAVSVANNHSLDYGAEAFLDTLARARRAGVEPVGGGAGLAAARRPVLFERGGLRVALLGYSDVRPLGFDAGPGKPGAARADLGWIREDVARARRLADIVVVYFHWGTELARRPDARQRRFADAALGAGATVVLGAHPHVLQPLERRGGRIIAWSLGNLVFGAGSPGTTETGILLVELGIDGAHSAELVPARIQGFTPVPEPERAARALRRLRAHA
jgi:poly-gamma-glutamate capsule biosynthesis protein CapA/YwtB (metallophosphatase superfamily)